MQHIDLKPKFKSLRFFFSSVIPAQAGIQRFKNTINKDSFVCFERNNQFYSRITNEKGSLMVIAIIILMLLTLIGIAITTTASLEMQIASNDRLHKMAFYQADGGIDIGAELLEQNLGCSGGFTPTIGTDQRNVGSVRVTDLTLWENSDDDATLPSETNRHFYFPQDYSGNQPHTNLTVGGSTLFSSGNAIQMVSGYEGKGKGSGAGGAFIIYNMQSQHLGIGGSQSIIQVMWRHVIGQEGACNY